MRKANAKKKGEKPSRFVTVQLKRDSPAVLAATAAATGARGDTVHAHLVRAAERYYELVPLLDEATKALSRAMVDLCDTNPVRDLLDKHDIFNGDITGTDALMLRVVKLLQQKIK